jgi:hypothetical protein
MEPIIFERADVRELAGELVKCGACTGIDLTQHVYDNWFLYAAPIKYINSCTDNSYICPSRLAFRAGDYVNTYHAYIFGMVKNAIDAIVHEMYENCSVKPVCYSAADEFELREIEEMHYAFEQIKNGDFEFVRDRAYELEFDAVHLHLDNELQLQLVANGTEYYSVKFRVYYGNTVIGEYA